MEEANRQVRETIKVEVKRMRECCSPNQETRTQAEEKTVEQSCATTVEQCCATEENKDKEDKTRENNCCC